MSEISTTPTLPPVTEESLLADRMSFWSSFTSATTVVSIIIVVLVLAMWVFLV